MNIFKELPEDCSEEVFEDIVRSEHIRIERIVSAGQVSDDWYDQDEHEWVIVLQGSAKLLFADGEEVALKAGDYVNITKHRKHKVSWTDPRDKTIWLAVFYR